MEVGKPLGVNYIQYRFNESEGKVSYLVEAPDPEAAEAVHREAHGLGPNRIMEVQQGT